MLIILAIINRYLAIRDYLLRLVIAEAQWYSNFWDYLVYYWV